MTRQAMLALLAWSSEQSLVTQAAFADFFDRRKASLTNDERMGADGSGTITYTMIAIALKEFDGTELEI